MRTSVRARPAIPLEEHGPHGRTPDFACAYELSGARDRTLTAESWARAAWEGSPAALRLLMVFGWRFVLGLRVGPLNSPAHILGWSIQPSSGEEVICYLSSGSLEAYNAFRASKTGVTWTTTVFYIRGRGRLVWLPVSLLHRPLVRIALRGAARRQPGPQPDSLAAVTTVRHD